MWAATRKSDTWTRELQLQGFPLATTENYTSKTGEKVSNTEWHNVVAWRGLAEVVEKYVKKGSQLYHRKVDFEHATMTKTE